MLTFRSSGITHAPRPRLNFLRKKKKENIRKTIRAEAGVLAYSFFSLPPRVIWTAVNYSAHASNRRAPDVVQFGRGRRCDIHPPHPRDVGYYTGADRSALFLALGRRRRYSASAGGGRALALPLTCAPATGLISFPGSTLPSPPLLPLPPRCPELDRVGRG